MKKDLRLMETAMVLIGAFGLMFAIFADDYIPIKYLFAAACLLFILLGLIHIIVAPSVVVDS